MKIFVLLFSLVFSVSGYGAYGLPHKDTPEYNDYFYRCVINTDEVMINLSDVFFRVKKDDALNAVRRVYAEYGESYVLIAEDMVEELYRDTEMSDKLDKFFFLCLNAVNNMGIEK